MTRLIYTLFIIILCISCKNASSQLQPKINGITLVAPHHEIDSTAITPIVDYHATHAVIVPYAWLKNLNDSIVKYNDTYGDWGEKPHGVKKCIQLMSDQQLQVMIKPQLWVGHGDYTGNIQLSTDEQWQQLEQSYTAYIMRFVHIAAQKKVALFCIGTELDSFVQQRPEYWKNLISQIRQVYDGQLTYAANWDNYDQVGIWEQLDYIGVDAYFPISDQKTPRLEEVKKAWIKWKEELSSLSRKRNKNILFTEYGYISADYAGKEPWKNAAQNHEVNQEAQAILLQGLYESVWHEPWFAGGCIWKHHANESRYRGFEKRFTPQGKMAQEVIKKYYTNTP